MANPVRSMDQIRPAIPEDAPRIIALAERIFPLPAPSSAEQRLAFFKRMFFENPWRDPQFAPLIQDDRDGNLRGFFAVVPRRMLARGQPVRVAVGTMLMVDPTHRSSLVGPMIMKRYLSGPQDISLADGATPSGRKLWEGMGGAVSLAHGYEWHRPLRPMGWLCAELKNRGAAALIASAARPLAAVFDAAATRLSASPLSPTVPDETSVEDLDSATVVQYQDEFFKRFLLRPDYDVESLDWLFDMLRQNRRHGDLRRRGVRDAEGTLVGWYVYYLKARGESRVMGLAAKRDYETVLRHLLHEAWREGSLGVSGRADPFLVDALNKLTGVFYRPGAGFLAASRDPAHLEAIRSGRAFTTHLDGEYALSIL